ncbi:MAG: cytochrome c-type biogenesis protein [Lysobacteraceae bacterium]
MIARLFAGLLLALMAFAAQAIDPIQFKDAAEEARFQSLAKELRCLVCQNESLADSTAGLAQDLRRDLIEQMRTGADDKQIKAYLTDRYGDFILYKPPVKPTTWLLWFGPAVMFAVALFVLIRIVRRNGPVAGEDSTDIASGDWE